MSSSNQQENLLGIGHFRTKRGNNNNRNFFWEIGVYFTYSDSRILLDAEYSMSLSLTFHLHNNCIKKGKNFIDGAEFIHRVNCLFQIGLFDYDSILFLLFTLFKMEQDEE